MASKSELPHDWRSSIEEKGVERINRNDGGDKHSDARLKEKLLVRLNVEDDDHPTVLCYALHLNKSLTPLSRFQISVISDYHVYAIGRDFEGKLKGFYYPRKVLKGTRFKWKWVHVLVHLIFQHLQITTVQVKVSYQDKNGNGSDIRLHLCHHKTHKSAINMHSLGNGSFSFSRKLLFGVKVENMEAFNSLLQKLDKYVPLGASVPDLYAGAGVIGLSLASTGKCRKELSVRCVEINKESKLAFEKTIDRLPSSTNSSISWHLGDTSIESLSWLVGSDVLVVDQSEMIHP
ncbi:hypothetical protein L1887_06940 [Cichorium endivia]|nr:hypothetical protein L1887_06940 [Cichorium endivia]